MAILVLSAALVLVLIYGIDGWVEYASKARWADQLANGNIELAAELRSYKRRALLLSIRAHGPGGEPVSIEARKDLVRLNEPWSVEIFTPLGPSKKIVCESIEIVWRNGESTVRMKLYGQLDYFYSHVEHWQQSIG